MSTSRLDPDAVLEELFHDRPSFHGMDEDSFADWHLSSKVVRFIARAVVPGDRTLETGCGYSTVAFAAAGAQHTAVSPFAHEHERIRQWCDGHGVPLDAVEFVAAASQDYLPDASRDRLDVVLVDGDHAFPAPSIDWYYAARRLRAGGLCIVDDVHIPAVAVLDDFLERDRDRWRPVKTFSTTHVYERLAGPFMPGGGWLAQPWSARVRRGPLVKAWCEQWYEQMRVDGIRNRIRRAASLRTRIRRAASLIRRRRNGD